ncbi:sialate O-acetylesterase [Verrucomicrobium sp. BvORR106]|uniref:sialate O-acetylesterase n=1 Tax=Verrucomicrobium sp. BvORR106 TaxID=1403819 RepID=UPI0005700213|nr:sialate O-acetylesterase [Verrucomicrobium sp. BvORR106]
MLSPSLSQRGSLALLALAGLLPTLAPAAVKLPHIFTDHMVLQRDVKIPVWGWADPGEKISVKLGQNAPVETTAGKDGKWRVELPAQAAGGAPLELTVTASNTVAVRDILVGEVWLCSGQSNMEWVVQNSLNSAQEIASANDPTIRHIKVPLVPKPVPQDDFNGSWQTASPSTVGGFTAAGYFMARELQKHLKVPVGLINASWGGTRIEPWVPAAGFEGLERLRDIATLVKLKQPGNPQYRERVLKHVADIEAWSKTVPAALDSGNGVSPSPAFPGELTPFATHGDPTTLYNAMVHPYVGFPIRGAIWYQGESNHGEGTLYTEKMKALVGGWRKAWGQGDFPFYYVQIAPFQYGQEPPEVLASFWEAQYAALSIPNTGIVPTTDIAELNDIHPKNKQEVGRRLAQQALKHTYGKKDVVASGPIVKSVQPEEGRLRVTFDHADGGLKSRNGQPLDWFEVIGEDTGYVKAQATVEGNAVVLTAPGVPKPTAVRFGWNKLAEPNLVNGAGWPAYPFQGGKVSVFDLLTKKLPETAGYQVLYDLDLSKLSNTPAYEVNNADTLKGTVEKVAWLLELKEPSSPAKYCFVSVDGFTNELKKLGVPTSASGAKFQIPVKNAVILSNVPGIPNGPAGDALNLEFWPDNYGPANTAAVPGASDTEYDTGDQISELADGYGSMQVNHHDAKTTLIAINHWVTGPQADIGIGPSPGQTKDWTFTQNASSYLYKRLRVLVKMK